VEKQTTRLVDDYDVVVVENLQVKNKVARLKPKLDPTSPGAYLSNGVSAKAGLNRSIHASGWTMFERRLVDRARQGRKAQSARVSPGPSGRENSSAEVAA
jgi:putative transposase